MTRIQDYRVGAVFNRSGPTAAQMAAFLRTMEERVQYLEAFTLCIPVRAGVANCERLDKYVPRGLVVKAASLGVVLRVQSYAERGGPHEDVVRWLAACDEVYCMPSAGHSAIHPDWVYGLHAMLVELGKRPKVIPTWGG